MEHITHYLFFLGLFLTSLFILYKDRLTLTYLKLFSLIALTAFIFFHIASPVLAIEHTEHQNPQTHPCCLPQTSTPVSYFEFQQLSVFIKLDPKPYTLTPHPNTVLNLNNKSPPALI